MRDLIWNDFAQAKYGDEYLCLYISLQKRIRRWYKILTILFSIGGIGTAIKGQNGFSVIIFFLIGLVQVISSIEIYIVHSEKQIDELHKLRMLYYDRANDLEQLFNTYEKVPTDQSELRFYELRKKSRDIEELDLMADVKKIEKLKRKALIAFNNYINSYYGKRTETRSASSKG
jgi:hypothetical protein